MAFNANRFDPQSTAEKAVSVIGYGYDLSADIQLSACKVGPSGSRLIEFDQTTTKDLVVPGGIVVPNVSSSIKCDKGERTRFRSDVLSFNEMSEQFNQELSLSGKIPSGLFNAMFGFKGCWQKDAATTKTLAFDGWFISLYNIELVRAQFSLSECLKQEVPPSWDPAALVKFIDKYGTHIVVGVKMGGKDVIHLKQLQESNLVPSEVQNLLKQLADERYAEDVNGSLESNPDKSSGNLKDGQSVVWDLRMPFASSVRRSIGSHSNNYDGQAMVWDLRLPFARSLRRSIGSHSNNDSMVRIHIRRGGIDNGQSHNQWLSTVSQSPNVISMTFFPIASLLSGVPGIGFLSHAINLYLRYKPPIDELRQFLEFQLPRQWAPAHGVLPLASRRKKQLSPALQFTFMGPKLYVNTVKVDSGNRPVTGVRLYLEGKKCDHLAIHLQHLSTLPKILQLSDDLTYEPIDELVERRYFEPVNWSIFSHICTAPVQYNGESSSIVTKAWFEVRAIGMKKVLFLRLGFSMVASAKICRSEWDGPTPSSPKLGLISKLTSTPSKKPERVDVNSAVYPGGPPLPTAQKMAQFVDTKEMLRGPEDLPGYWVINGAKLCVEGGRIRINGKYCLLTIMSEDSVDMSRS